MRCITFACNGSCNTRADRDHSERDTKLLFGIYGKKTIAFNNCFFFQKGTPITYRLPELVAACCVRPSFYLLPFTPRLFRGLPFPAATSGRAAAPFTRSSSGPSPATSIHQVCPPLRFHSAVRNGAPQPQPKLFGFGSDPKYVYCTC
jgi:hypothetical protein